MKKHLYISIILFLLHNPCKSQVRDFFYGNYSDNSAEAINKSRIKEKYQYEIKISSDGDTSLSLQNIAFYNVEGNKVLEKDFFNQDTTDFDYVNYKYENKNLIETVSIMVEPYDEVKTVYHYRKNNLIEYCDYSRVDPNEKLELDSCTILKYKNDRLFNVKSKGNVVYTYEIKDTINQFDSNHTLIARYFNNNKIVKFDPNKKVIYKYNSDGNLEKIIEKSLEDKIISRTTFNWRNEILRSSITINCETEEKEKIIYQYVKWED